MSKEEWVQKTFVLGEITKTPTLTEKGFLESDPDSDLWQYSGIDLLNAWFNKNEVPDMTNERAAIVLEEEVFRVFTELGRRFGWLENDRLRNYVTACRKAADACREKAERERA